MCTASSKRVNCVSCDTPMTRYLNLFAINLAWLIKRMYRRIIYVCIYRCYIKYSGRYWQHHFLYITKTFAIFIQLQHTATTPITKRKRRKYIKKRQLCIAVILDTYIIPYIEDRKSIDVKVANVGELWVK